MKAHLIKARKKEIKWQWLWDKAQSVVRMHTGDKQLILPTPPFFFGKSLNYLKCELLTTTSDISDCALQSSNSYQFMETPQSQMWEYESLFDCLFCSTRNNQDHVYFKLVQSLIFFFVFFCFYTFAPHLHYKVTFKSCWRKEWVTEVMRQ